MNDTSIINLLNEMLSITGNKFNLNAHDLCHDCEDIHDVTCRLSMLQNDLNPFDENDMNFYFDKRNVVFKR